jgi:hypothetical protein
MKNSNAIAIYNIGAKNLQTAQVCVDRLHELGATHELKLLTGACNVSRFEQRPSKRVNTQNKPKLAATDHKQITADAARGPQGARGFASKFRLLTRNLSSIF